LKGLKRNLGIPLQGFTLFAAHALRSHLILIILIVPGLTTVANWLWLGSAPKTGECPYYFHRSQVASA
jgi:hypothetical protein